MITPHFTKIRKEIMQELDLATDSIKIAVYWFTNQELFDKLIEKMTSHEVKVELIIHNDCINNFTFGLPLQTFIDSGGALYFSEGENPMHNKYCIIDEETLITGSYNWTYWAETKNSENILIVKEDRRCIEEYLTNFEFLKQGKVKREQAEPFIFDDIRDSLDKFMGLRPKDKGIGRFPLRDLDFVNYFLSDHLYKFRHTEISKDSNTKDWREIFNKIRNGQGGSIDLEILANDLFPKKKVSILSRDIREVVGRPSRASLILKKGTKLPYKKVWKTVTLDDEQASCQFKLQFGESDNPEDNHNLKMDSKSNDYLLKIDGLPPLPAGKCVFYESLVINTNGWAVFTVRCPQKSIDSIIPKAINIKNLYTSKRYLSIIEETTINQ